MALRTNRALSGGCWLGRGLDKVGQEIPTCPYLPLQYGDFGVKGTDLWLAASGDQRVSIWASDWPRDHCELVDWLSFPAPVLMKVRVPVAPQVGLVPVRPTAARCASPQAPDCSPPSLAAFCPWDRALLACAGLGPHPEVVFYSLSQKQARACPRDPGKGESWAVGTPTGFLTLTARRW